MSQNFEDLRSEYTNLLPTLEKIAGDLEKEITERVGTLAHVDRVICRCKTVESFMKKAEKVKNSGALKYDVPLKEIQDKIGARVVVYYKTDVERIKQEVSTYFRRIEEQLIVPDDVSKFGYEGFHMICKLPNSIYSTKNNPEIGDFFELQIKTLYQHAWSQSNHGLGYKPGEELNSDEQRLLAFIAAQSWGADKGLLELSEEKHKNH